MAPRKRSSGGEEAPPATARVTRGSIRRLNGGAPAAAAVAEPKKRRASKKAKTAVEDVGPVANSSKARTIVIEHCKQCNQFKIRAVQVKNGLENGVPGITVLVNPEKPRRGCFEIRDEGGEKFITLLDMKRPFTPMKELDMEKVISDIIDKIK